MIVSHFGVDGTTLQRFHITYTQAFLIYLELFIIILVLKLLSSRFLPLIN